MHGTITDRYPWEGITILNYAKFRQDVMNLALLKVDSHKILKSHLGRGYVFAITINDIVKGDKNGNICG